MQDKTSVVRKLNAFRLSGAVPVLVVAVLALSLAWQGWNSRVMNFDYINFIGQARSFVSDGVWPDRGEVSSYWAFATPGAALLMVPGMFVFHDPRLYESIAAAALYVGTLFGVFALARMCFGLTCAYLSVLVYGLSRNGLFYAGSIYPIGHPFFYIWMAYFSLLWVRRNEAGYLGASIAMWAVGLYLDMVLAPAAFLIPAIWLLYRPRLRFAPLAVAALVVAAVWFPYLRFEQTRSFADLKSLVSRQSLRPLDYRQSWCNPALVVQRLNEPTRPSEAESSAAPAANLSPDETQASAFAALKAHIRLRSETARDGIKFNFDQMTWSASAATLLLLLTVTALGLVAFDSAARRSAHGKAWKFGWLSPTGWALLVVALAVNEIFIARYLSDDGTLADVTVKAIRTLQVALGACGLVLVAGHRWIASRISRLRDHQQDNRDDVQVLNAGVTAVALVVPWLVLIMVAEPNRYDRYFWLWPMQVIFLVASVTYLPKRLHWPRAAARLAQVALVAILLTHPWLSAPVAAWVSSGWSGPRISDLQAADFIAERLKAEGRHEAAIGYQTYFAGFMARQHVIDSRYKAGGELDLYLRQRYGIVNTSSCAEGVSPADEFRIVQQPPSIRPDVERAWLPMGGEVKTHELLDYFPTASDPRFLKLRQFGDFEVIRRAPVGVGESLAGR